MTEDQAFEIVGIIGGLWPNPSLKEETVNAYVRFLQEWDFEEVQASVGELAVTAKFLPTIAEIVERCDVPIQSRRMTEDELHWSGHNPEDFPDWKLPESVIEQRTK